MKVSTITSNIFSIKFIVSFILLTVLSEHFGRLNDIQYRPTFFLNKIADYSTDLFEYCGYIFAVLSSFYDKLQLTEVLKTMVQLIGSVFSIIISPFYFNKVYVETAHTYVFPPLIFLGSITLVTSLIYIVYKLFGTQIFDYIKTNYPDFAEYLNSIYSDEHLRDDLDHYSLGSIILAAMIVFLMLDVFVKLHR